MTTLADTVRAAAARLQAAGVAFGHGTANAVDEAAWLVLWRLGLPLDALDEHAARGLTAAEAAAVDALVQQRIATRRPAAYLTGEAWLQGVPFTVDERVIVPRSLIAELVADADGSGALDAWLAPDTRRVLDLCTGGGSLAILAAMAWPEVDVLATDLSADALAVASLNLQRHGLAHRIRLAQGDGWASVDALGEREPFDLILCNPPYVNARSMAALPAEYRAEPRLALAGGSDGMDFIRPLLAGLGPHLARDGVLVLEIGHEIEHFHRAFPRLPIVGLPTSAGDEQVLLIEAAALRFLA
ncbi:MAG: 50S ribosomal protein L3 N(5)-glutamine methyltransferase [Burkholderiaceae bacterium]|nr:50S ribosomal protein L3 N(5)-glutamine methyltransferase [Burkholderiaceae bacterium]MCZ8177298.1 50S ribosomal protein L3 N(5)-glutamine methyltransferase [Burkholderiaceae bacterium]